MRGLRVLGAMTLVALCISATGCAKLQERFKPAPKVVVIAPRVASEEATLAGPKLAPYRPPSVVVWPGSTVIRSANAQTPQGKSWTANFTTPDDYEAVVKGFAVALKKAGWTAEVADMSTATEKSSLLSAARDNADALYTFTRSTDSSVTVIDLVVTPK